MSGKCYEPLSLKEWQSIAFPTQNRLKKKSKTQQAWAKETRNAPGYLFVYRSKGKPERPQRSLLKANPLCHLSFELLANDTRLVLAPHYQKWQLLQQTLKDQGASASKVDSQMGVQSKIWISNQRLQTGLHFDTQSNTLSLINGVKYVILLPPNDAQYLYSRVDA